MTSKLREHAEREMKLAGVDDDIYGDMTSKAVLELIDVFNKQGHSGASGGLVLSIFNRVVNWNNLTPLTDNPEEWEFHDGVWQNRRNSSCFSSDGGKTYYDLDTREDYDEDGRLKRDDQGKPLRRMFNTVSHQEVASND